MGTPIKRASKNRNLKGKKKKKQLKRRLRQILYHHERWTLLPVIDKINIHRHKVRFPKKRSTSTWKDAQRHCNY